MDSDLIPLRMKTASRRIHDLLTVNLHIHDDRPVFFEIWTLSFEIYMSVLNIASEISEFP